MSSLTSFDDLLKSGPSIHHQSKDGETEVKTESNKDSDEDSNKDQSIKDDDIDEYTDALDAPDSPPPHFNTLIELELSHDSNVIPDSDNGGSSSPASATTIQQQPVFPHLPPNPTQPNFDSLDSLESIESNDDSDDNDLIKGSIASISRPNLTAWASRRKHFFVLSSAGKPIYARHGSESEVTELMGVFQTIIAFFEHDIDDADGSGDVLQSFTAGSHLFCFKIIGPLYLVGVSSIGESETELQKQLTKLHAQILSTTTLTKITRIFAKRQNYDLRLLLTGTDTFLHKTTTNFRRTASIDATPVCAMPPKLRARLHKTMSVSNTPPKHVIYSILTTPTTILAIHRPSSKTPLLDPADVIILHTLIQSNLASFKTGIEVWTPLCLPRYNSSVFLNAYVCCLVSSTGPDASSSVVGGGGIGDSRGLGSSRNAGHPQDRYHANEDVFCVVMSTEREGFFGVSEYKAGIVS
ncbi:Vacuolar fusion protein mon1, partial [Rhizoclosmatium hyalinum]